MNVETSVYLDVRRRSKKTGKFPVKLRVYTSDPKKENFYGIIVRNSKLHLLPDEFDSSYKNPNPRGKNRDLKEEIQAVETRAREIISHLDPFSFEEFGSIFRGKPLKGWDVFGLFDEVVKRKEQVGAMSTAEKYQTTSQTLKAYLEHHKRNTSKLSFREVTVEFLEDLERYCKNHRGNSIATIAINMRNLRAVYRKAMEKDDKLRGKYPFGEGEGKYTIKKSGKVNKALTEDQLKTLWQCEPHNEHQAIAKDFWFFAYFSYGMNLRDICELKHSDLDGQYFRYERAKTRTTRREQKINEVPVTKNLAAIIARRKDVASKWLFGILKEGEGPKATRGRISRFNAYLNDHFRDFAFYAGIDSTLAKQLGMYHARHSFATIAVRRKHSIELISEILHDGNIRTTQSYLNSFSKETFDTLSGDLDL